LPVEHGQQPRRVIDRRDRVARVDEAARGSGFGRELRDALGAGRARRRAAEPAFGPQQPRQKAHRQAVCARGIGDGLTDERPVVGRRRARRGERQRADQQQHPAKRDQIASP
jgi:hypothetical protein